MPKIYNPDGLVEHRATSKKAPKKTLATVLEELLVRDDVRAAVAVWLAAGLAPCEDGLPYIPATASVGEIVATAISNDLLLATIDHAQKLTAASPPLVAFPAFVACALLAWSFATPHTPNESQARAFRHFAYHAMAAGPRETSPIRLKPTATELRHREAVRRWWK